MQNNAGQLALGQKFKHMFFFDDSRRVVFFPKSLDVPTGDVRQAIADFLRLDEREREQTDAPPVWKVPLDRDVHDALAELSYGRCAFCERLGQTLQPYRFRPPAYADRGSGKPDKASYLWLAYRWENLYPICHDCLPERKEYFPVRGRRSPVPAQPDLWFDPSLPIDEAEEPMFYQPGLNRVLAKYSARLNGQLMGEAKAARTLEHFKLNRPDLILRRGEAFTDIISGLHERELRWSEKHRQSALRDEFGGAVFILLRRFANEFRYRVDGPTTFTRTAIEAWFPQWFQTNGYEQLLDETLHKFEVEDADEPDRQFRAADIQTAPTAKSDLAPPRIARVEIENFKSLESVAVDFVGRSRTDPVASVRSGLTAAQVPQVPCMLLLGENSTGKSSFLEAVALACVEDDILKRLAQAPSEILLNPEYMGERRERVVETGSIVVRFDDGTANRLVIDRAAADIRVERENPAAAKIPVFAYGAHRLFGTEQLNDPLAHVGSLFDGQRRLSNPETWLRQLEAQNPDGLDEVVSALRHIIQIDGEFSHIEVREGKCLINIKRRDGAGEEYLIPQRLDIASSGYRAIFALVCDVLKGLFLTAPSPRDARNSHALVLIDEIEAHLHPRWKLQIITGLRRALPKTTFMFTSHDPLCVRGMLNGEVVMLNRYLDNSDPDYLREKVESNQDFGNVQTLTVEQLLTSEMFQLYSTDDRLTDVTFGRAAFLLAKEAGGEFLSEDELSVLSSFRTEIADALPYGTTDVTRLVHEAVAEYLRDRRSANREDRTSARVRAKNEIKALLKDLLQ